VILFEAWFVLATALEPAAAIGALCLLDDSLEGQQPHKTIVRWVDADTVTCILYPPV